MSSYSNFKALKALTKASLQSITKSPSAVVFSIAFPLVFIVAFGFLGGDKAFQISVAPSPATDTNTALYKALSMNPAIRWSAVRDSTGLTKALKNAEIAAVLDIRYQESATPHYQIKISGPESQMDKLAQLRSILNETVQSLDPELSERIARQASVLLSTSDMREFRTIDFILPGQLGFSLLAGSVFGTAFIFFNMRQTLVLKRFFATPVRRGVIIFSEGIARMVFQLITAFVIIGVGYYVFHFHLVNGWLTVFQMLLICIIGVLVFMGFGFMVSGLAKNEATIPPLANMITMPQFLLAGTFFPIDSFPKWLQPISRAMPLTYLNDALRKTAFEGAGLWTLRWDLAVLLLWGMIIYFITAKVFKWE